MSTAAPRFTAEDWPPVAIRPGHLALPGGVDVWLVPPAPERLGAAWAVLSADERARAGGFATAALRADYVTAHAGLRAILAGYLGAEPGELAFTAGRWGKPALAPPRHGLEFSLSHSAGLALVAVSAAGPVGVDLERIAAPLDEIADLAFSPGEVAELAAADGAARMRRSHALWCAKEAAAKAEGTGLAADLRALPGPWRISALPPLAGVASALADRGGAPPRCRCLEVLPWRGDRKAQSPGLTPCGERRSDDAHSRAEPGPRPSHA